MSILDAIPILGKLFSDTTDIIKEAVVDKDKQNEIIGNLEAARQAIDKEIYVRELETKTVTWVDALHKMGRQLLNLITIVGVFILLLCDVDISGPEAAIIGGPNMVYQYVKKAGK
jgi:hypothetical protein